MRQAEKNYFKILGISPYASEKDIEEAIRTKQNLWNRGRGSRRHDYEGYRRQLDDIKDVMLYPHNPTFRLMQEELIAGRDKRMQGLKSDLRLEANAYGEIAIIDVQYMANSEIAKELFISIDDIRKLAHESGLKIVDQVSEISPTDKPRLEINQINRIEQLLNQLGFQTLYEFLGLPRNSDGSVLVHKAEEIQRNSRDNVNRDPTVGATAELAGTCMMFETSEFREGYEALLQREQYRPVLDKASSYAGGRKHINIKELNELLRLGRSNNITDADSYIALIQDARDHEWEIDTDMTCPDCGEINSYGLIYCRMAKCAAELFPELDKYLCNHCNQSTPQLGDFCIKCGQNILNEIGS